MEAFHSKANCLSTPSTPSRNPIYQPIPSPNYPHQPKVAQHCPTEICYNHVLSLTFISPKIQNQEYSVSPTPKPKPGRFSCERRKVYVLLLHHRGVMMNSPVQASSHLSFEDLAAQLTNLNCDDEPVIDLQDDEDDMVIRREWELSLIGKVITDKYINPQTIMRAMRNAWFRIPSLAMHEMEEGMVAFKFVNETDLLFAKENGPWLVNDYLLVLRRWMPNTPVAELRFDTMPFWIKAFNIPCEKIKKSTGLKLGSIAGGAMEVDFVETRDSKCKFMRFRAMIQLNKRLIPGTWITLDDRERIWSSFRYERLPVYCFFCGIIGHAQSNCRDLKIKEAKRNKGEETDVEIPIHKQYGPWLKALSREAEINEQKARLGGFKTAAQGRGNAGMKGGSVSANPNRVAQYPSKLIVANNYAANAHGSLPAAHARDERVIRGEKDMCFMEEVEGIVSSGRNVVVGPGINYKEKVGVAKVDGSMEKVEEIILSVMKGVVGPGPNYKENVGVLKDNGIMEEVVGPGPNFKETCGVSKADGSMEGKKLSQGTIPPGFHNNETNTHHQPGPSTRPSKPADQTGPSSFHGLRKSNEHPIHNMSPLFTPTEKGMQPNQPSPFSTTTGPNILHQVNIQTPMSSTPHIFSASHVPANRTNPNYSNIMHPTTTTITEKNNKCPYTEPHPTTNINHHTFIPYPVTTTIPEHTNLIHSTPPHHTTPIETMESYPIGGNLLNNTREDHVLDGNREAYEDGNCRRKRRFHSQNSIKVLAREVRTPPKKMKLPLSGTASKQPAEEDS